MSLDKAIQHGKERRRPYRGSAAFDPACRHGRGGTACPWCRRNRRIATIRLQVKERTDE